jgi:tetratricopeptide (TPR) repeat protein
MNLHFERGTLLYRQHRLEQAAEQFRLGLAESPDDARAHALLGLTLSGLGRHEEATREVTTAIGSAPADPFNHYALALVQTTRDDDAAALRSIEEAIRLEPADPDYHSVRGQVQMHLRRWEEALASAERALALDAEHEGANNVRAMALLKLGRRAEAGATLDATLARNPDDSWTHANMGWTRLDGGDPRRALSHFQEALRLEPVNEWARQGVVEALKATNPLYALLLRYFLWMSKLSRRAQWGVIIGGWLGNRLLAESAAANPGLAPWVWPLRILYLVFVWLTWSAQPLFNLVLRLNRYGRLALSDEQRAESNWVGLSVAAAIGCALMAALAEEPVIWVAGAGVFGFLVLPIAARYNCQPGWPRRVMTGYAVVMAGLGVGAFAMLVGLGWMPEATARPVLRLAMPLLVAYAIGLMVCPWVGNALAMVQPKK